MPDDVPHPYYDERKKLMRIYIYGAGMNKFQKKRFNFFLDRTDISNYVVNGPESVTPLHAKYCEVKIKLKYQNIYKSNKKGKEVV